MELSKKVAYIKGLMDGLKIDDSTNEGKILRLMSDVLEEMAASVEDVASEVNDTVDLLDAVDEDLGNLENDYYGIDDDDDDEDFDDDDEDEEEDDSEDFDADEMYECECPNCGETISLDASIIAAGSVNCPNCGETLEFDGAAEEDTDNKEE